jgi:hypothetical protein
MDLSMSNFTPDELRSLANKMLWEEILPPKHAEITSRGYTSDGKRQTLSWLISASGDSIEGFTEGEDGPFIVADPAAHKFQKLTKFEALKMFQFGGNFSLVAKYLSQRSESNVSTTADISRSIYGLRLEEILALPIDERLKVSEMFVDSVASDRFVMESREVAKQQMREAQLGQDGPPVTPVLMKDFINQVGVETKFLIESLALWESTVILFAQAKVGKTTLVFNLLRAIADQEPFLGVFDVSETLGNVGFLNYELTDELCRTWAKRIPIENTERVIFWNLRGLNNPFRSREAMKEFAEDVLPMGVETLVLDPLSGAFIGDTNNNDEVKRFFLMLEEFKVLAGVKHLFIMVHAGNDATKPRGATTLRDHPDAIWSMTKNAAGIRFFKAEGRDVSLDEGVLSFDENTGLLTFEEGSSKAATPSVMKMRFYDFIVANPRSKASDIDSHFKCSKDRKSAIRNELVAEGLVAMDEGPRNAKYYTAVSSPVVLESFSGIGRLEVSSRSPLFIRGTTGGEDGSHPILECSKCGESPKDDDVIAEIDGEGTLCPHCLARDWQLLMAAAKY